VWANLHQYASVFRQLARSQGWRQKLGALLASPGSARPGTTPPVGFAPSAFQRFATPAPLWMALLGAACNVLGTGLLMHFLWSQSHWPLGERAAYAAGMVVFYLAVGTLWLHPRVTGQPKG
jgi:hypothetical protein